jgi:hypothetical protein
VTNLLVNRISRTAQHATDTSFNFSSPGELSIPARAQAHLQVADLACEYVSSLVP